MYFLLADLMHRFIYLELRLAFVLIWVGSKMLLLDVYKIPTTSHLETVMSWPISLFRPGAIAKLSYSARGAGRSADLTRNVPFTKSCPGYADSEIPAPASRRR